MVTSNHIVLYALPKYSAVGTSFLLTETLISIYKTSHECWSLQGWIASTGKPGGHNPDGLDEEWLLLGIYSSRGIHPTELYLPATENSLWEP